jgi:hypothetical protein
MRLIFICFCALILAMPVYATIINVPGEYATIQAGIDASVNGDTVLVAPGEYVESDTIENKNILLKSSEGPSATVIRGYFSLLGSQIDSNCILLGFDFNGYGLSGSHDHLIYSHQGAPIIWGNIIENNISTFRGAGILLEDSPAIIRSNIIRNNWAGVYGGGIYATDSDTMVWDRVIIEGNIVSGNWAGDMMDHGDYGGIAMSKAGIIRYNLVTGNRANRVIYAAYGGGIAAGVSKTKIYNNTIVGNMAFGQGGHGMGGGLIIWLIDRTGDGFAKNNIIAFNSNGGGVYGYVLDSAYMAWDYNLLFSNDSANYIHISPGPHDIQTDPLFADRFSGDYHLLFNSPCIDAGDPSFPLDPDSTRCDIGAYFFNQSVGLDEDGAPSGPYRFTLSQNYPNPFNSQTIISYYLDRESTVSLHIYAITGHLILPLVNKELQKSGKHKYTWDGRDAGGRPVSTGIYFYELYVDGSKESKAMIMIK